MINFIMAMFLIASGFFIMGIYDPNQPVVINTVNLPETRGSVYALNRFVEELGEVFGPLIVGIFFVYSGQNYSIALTIGMLFMIPSAICWWLVLKTYLSNKDKTQEVLKSRK